MIEYAPPSADAEFVLNRLFDLPGDWSNIPSLAEVSADLVAAVVEEAGKVARNALAPVNQIGDSEGCTWQDGEVRTPDGFAGGYRALADGGWLGLSGNPEFEGQGMPKSVACVVEEMFWGANTALYLYGTLSVGASICIDAHGTPEQKALYLPKLYSGQWSGAMALTEAHAGTDLGLLRTRAQPQSDGTYAITGTKIFITSGEHDLAENIVHLTLARLPDAPSGSRGISLFIVPKFLPDDGGNPGQRNGFASGSIEHKMGINGSATSVINYDGATGYLLGEANQGLAAMFTMMNYERLSVGLQGLGANELSYQRAAAYANDRLQGRAPSGPLNVSGPADPLTVHPDVRRMLLTQRAFAEGGRAFAVFVGHQLDLAKHNDDPAAERLAQLLTPVAKAFLTDRGFEAAVLAQQIYGGHGYVKEWGVEQIVRDARIGQIYEGTNGVQALDLITRKVLRDGGETLGHLLERMRAEPGSKRFGAAVLDACDRLQRVTLSLVERSGADPDLAGAVSVDYLDLVGLTVFAWLWSRMDEVAGDDAFGRDKRAVAEFYFARLLPRCASIETGIAAPSAATMGGDAVSFEPRI